MIQTRSCLVKSLLILTGFIVSIFKGSGEDEIFLGNLAIYGETGEMVVGKVDHSVGIFLKKKGGLEKEVIPIVVFDSPEGFAYFGGDRGVNFRISKERLVLSSGNTEGLKFSMGVSDSGEDVFFRIAGSGGGSPYLSLGLNQDGQLFRMHSGSSHIGAAMVGKGANFDLRRAKAQGHSIVMSEEGIFYSIGSKKRRIKVAGTPSELNFGIEVGRYVPLIKYEGNKVEVFSDSPERK